ncbi:DNA repair exonuclease [Lactiplantibacillus garii]|uniref:DNA repair exonuclease n=1 Tax=Lactiplantibacillus garii TaxID=2306423 RepID=A0A3R8J5R0_9LACO|nr:DNA repair exonuclease [Lactiplantibacillus garii]RRK09771.1 DNA repair exonuclease [Lactiplantibacillus garii]
MKFLHAADLHLDTPFLGLSDLPGDLQQRLIQAPLAALHRLVDLALDERVDFVLLVGDLFDSQAQSVQAQAALMSELERLHRVQIPVLLSFGNHDFQPDLTTWHFPANVHVFGPQVETVTLTTSAQERVAVSGFSYGQRWVATDPTAAYPLKTSTEDYHVGTLHGQVGQAGDHYAPFSVGELLEKHYDYWALGHIHQRQTLNAQPPVVYAGNLQGRHRGETGAKGALIVTSRGDHQLVPTFKALTDIVWTDWPVSLDGTYSRASLLSVLSDQLNAQATHGLQLVSLTLPASVHLDEGAELALTQGALLAQLRAKANAHWWPVQIERAASTPTTPQFGVNAATWQAAGQQVVTATAIADLAGNLLNEAFLNTALLEDTTPEQWQAQVMRLLTDQYHLTTGGANHVD